MKVDSWECDVCNVQKKKANKWWKVFRCDTGVLVLPWDTERVGMFNTDYQCVKLEDADAHLCGADCVTQWLSRNLL